MSDDGGWDDDGGADDPDPNACPDCGGDLVWEGDCGFCGDLECGYSVCVERGPCEHDCMTQTDDPDVWECDGCGALIREVDDPNGPISSGVRTEAGWTTKRIRYELVRAGREP